MGAHPSVLGAGGAGGYSVSFSENPYNAMNGAMGGGFGGPSHAGGRPMRGGPIGMGGQQRFNPYGRPEAMGQQGFEGAFGGEFIQHGPSLNLDKLKERKPSIGTTTGHSIHMKGLPWTATVTEVIEFLDPLRPADVRIEKDKDDRPIGRCDVDFKTHDEACRAMLKDKNQMGNRWCELYLRSAEEGIWPRKSGERGDFGGDRGGNRGGNRGGRD